MALNGVMALILRYSTEFVYAVVVKQCLYLFSKSTFDIVYDDINTICRIIQRVFG